MVLLNIEEATRGLQKQGSQGLQKGKTECMCVGEEQQDLILNRGQCIKYFMGSNCPYK